MKLVWGGDDCEYDGGGDDCEAGEGVMHTHVSTCVAQIRWQTVSICFMHLHGTHTGFDHAWRQRLTIALTSDWMGPPPGARPPLPATASPPTTNAMGVAAADDTLLSHASSGHPPPPPSPPASDFSFSAAGSGVVGHIARLESVLGDTHPPPTYGTPHNNKDLINTDILDNDVVNEMVNSGEDAEDDAVLIEGPVVAVQGGVEEVADLVLPCAVLGEVGVAVEAPATAPGKTEESSMVHKQGGLAWGGGA